MTDNNNNGKSGEPEFDELMSEQYLFGELTEAEQERFERAYFANDAFFERFLAVKNELLDLYSRGELDTKKRDRMEQYFLSTGPRRRRLNETIEFNRAVSTIAARQASGIKVQNPQTVAAGQSGPEPSNWFRSIQQIFTLPRLAAATVVLLIATVATFWVIIRPRSVDQAVDSPPTSNSSDVNVDPGVTPNNSSGEVASDDLNRSESNPARSSEVAVNSDNNQPLKPTSNVPVANSKSTPETPQIARDAVPNERQRLITDPLSNQRPELAGNRTESITLDGSTRSATSRNTANLGTATRGVSIRLHFGSSPFPTYSVRIQTIGGSTVWRGRNLTAPMTGGSKSLTVSVPANVLTSKDYIVILDGRTTDGQTETIREYYFHVDRSGSN